MNNSTRMITILLVLVLGLQYWTLNRQEEVDQRISNLTNQLAQVDVRHRLDTMQTTLAQMNEATQWVTVARSDVEPGAGCESAQARIDWTLKEWREGTAVRLLYRSGPDQAWQEAKVDSQGGPNYSALFPVSAKPMLQVQSTGFSYGGPGPRGGAPIAETVVEAREKSAYDRDYQYQIIAEGPDGSRSTGLRNLPLYGYMFIPVDIQVRVEKDRYLVDIHAKTGPGSPCMKIEGIDLLAYAGEALLATVPFTARENSQLFTVEWNSQEQPDRIEVAIRHTGGRESVSFRLK